MRRPNKRMQLTKLRAAPVLQAEVPPCAPAGQTGGGTASQLIRGVGRTMVERASIGKIEGSEASVKIRALALVGIVAAMFAGSARAVDKPEDLARTAAEAWLKLIDAGDAGASWDQAAKLFKGAVTKEQWVQALAGVRPPLGKVISRKLASRQYSEKLPGAPDGKYVTIQYDTVFENKASAVETITPMLDPDGVWRVSGYFIR